MEYPLGWYFIGLLSFQTECIVEQKIKREPNLFTDMNSHFFIYECSKDGMNEGSK